MSRIRTVVIFVVASLLGACGDSSGPKIGPPASLAVVSGDGQQGEAGTALPSTIAVRVNDASGNAVPNVAIAFAVTGGGGSISALSTATDAQGTASARWTLGTSAGTQTATATVAGVTALVISATAKAGTPTALEKSSGDLQLGTVASATPTRPTVKVADRYGNAVSGAVVNWSTSAGASVAANATQTDASGLATAAWTLGTTATTYKLTASLPGTSSVEFTATAQPGPVATLNVTPGNLQLEWGTTQQFTASAKDGYGNSVQKPVAWVSSNPNVASVSGTGMLSAVRAGATTLTASLDSRSASSDVTVTALNEKITIENDLIYDVNVYANGARLGTVAALTYKEFTIATPTNGLTVSWDLIRQTRTDGIAIGDNMSGTFPSEAATPTTEFYVDNQIGTTTYFTPWMRNLSTATWLAGVNMGLSAENRCNCSIPTDGKYYNLGYYKWVTNSNVRAYLLNSGYVGPFLNWTISTSSLYQYSGEITLESTTAPTKPLDPGIIVARTMRRLNTRNDKRDVEREVPRATTPTTVAPIRER